MKLTFSKPKFIHYTKNDQQVTKCIYKCKMVTPDGNIVYDFVVDGYAVCSPNDEYKPRTGEIIADSRAKSNAYTKCRNRIAINLEEHQDIIFTSIDMVKFFDKMQFLKKQEAQHLEFVLNENNT